MEGSTGGGGCSTLPLDSSPTSAVEGEVKLEIADAVETAVGIDVVAPTNTVARCILVGGTVGDAELGRKGSAGDGLGVVTGGRAWKETARDDAWVEDNDPLVRLPPDAGMPGVLLELEDTMTVVV